MINGLLKGYGDSWARPGLGLLAFLPALPVLHNCLNFVAGLARQY